MDRRAETVNKIVVSSLTLILLISKSAVAWTLVGVQVRLSLACNLTTQGYLQFSASKVFQFSMLYFSSSLSSESQRVA